MEESKDDDFVVRRTTMMILQQPQQQQSCRHGNSVVQRRQQRRQQQQPNTFLLLQLIVVTFVSSMFITIHGFIILPTTTTTRNTGIRRPLCNHEAATKRISYYNYQQQQQQYIIFHRYNPSAFNLYATKKKNTKSSSSSSKQSGVGMKGFGGGVVITPKTVVDSSASSLSTYYELDRSTTVRNFCLYMEQHQQQTAVAKNWQRTGLAYFPLVPPAESNTNNNNDDPKNGDGTAITNNKLRGVVALQDISKGQEIITIPYELAINLGEEGADPTIPAIIFLQQYCSVMNSDIPNRKNQPTIKSYYELLPNLYNTNADCLGSTDFFTEKALQELQYPPVIQETKQRKARMEQRYNEWKLYYDANNALPLMWNTTTPVLLEHFQWAVWIITSRVLTVQGPADSNNKYYRLLIPYLDMCNHDRDSVHILTGRATAGGTLKIIAGTTVKAGTPINIVYGGGTAGNDRFIQDYGFLDTNPAAYESIANELLGKKPRGTSSSHGTTSLSLVQRDEALQALQQTTIEYDENLLNSGTIMDPQIRSAIQFRLGIKQALAKIQ